MGTRLLVYINGCSDGSQVWYCIDDLESRKQTLSPVGVLDFEGIGSWTVIGEDIYWVGGVGDNNPVDDAKCPKGTNKRWPGRSVSNKLYKHNTRKTDSAKWDIVSDTKRIRWSYPCVVPFEDKIYVLGGNTHFEPSDTRDRNNLCGEVYNLGTQNWERVALGVHHFLRLTDVNTALMDNKETIVCCSPNGFLFYNICTDSYLWEYHPTFWGSLDNSMFLLLTNVKPVASKSRLYWFALDLRLCAYDLHLKKWLYSTRLEQKICCTVPCLFDYPALVHLHDDAFLLLFSESRGELKAVHFTVSVCGDSLDVSVGHTCTFSVKSDFHFVNGIPMIMAMQAAARPSAQVVGNAFVEQYYQIQNHSPEQVYRFYQDSSVLSRPDSNGVMTSATTIKNINDMICSLDYKNYRAEIKSADAQESFKDGVIVLVTGCLTGKDNLRRKFTQTFFLTAQDKGYFVLNDVFRYVEENETATVSEKA